MTLSYVKLIYQKLKNQRFNVIMPFFKKICCQQSSLKYKSINYLKISNTIKIVDL